MEGRGFELKRNGDKDCSRSGNNDNGDGIGDFDNINIKNDYDNDENHCVYH